MTNEISRRKMIKQVAVGSATVIVGLQQSAQATTKAKIISTQVISYQPEKYHGWPTLAQRKNGELLLVCSGGRESHVCPFGRVEFMRSKDEGRHWSFPRTLIDGAIDDRDAGLLETAKGTLLVSTFTSLAYESYLNKARKIKQGEKGRWQAGKLKRWIGAHERTTAEQRQVQLGVWMIRSTDGGISWSTPYDSLVNSPHGPIQLADGRLLYAGKDLWREGTRVGVCQSTNDGKTWKWLSQIPVREGDLHKNYHELHAVEAANGTLIVHIQNHNKKNAGETLQSESNDGGKTWSPPHSIGVWGLPSHLLKLKDNRLLMTYGFRTKPYGNQARVSSDNGKTWSEAITISDDGVGHDLGYPSTIQLKDGSLLTVWYENMKKSSKAVLRQSHWQLM